VKRKKYGSAMGKLGEELDRVQIYVVGSEAVAKTTKTAPKKKKLGSELNRKPERKRTGGENVFRKTQQQPSNYEEKGNR